MRQLKKIAYNYGEIYLCMLVRFQFVRDSAIYEAHICEQGHKADKIEESYQRSAPRLTELMVAPFGGYYYDTLLYLHNHTVTNSFQFRMSSFQVKLCAR